MVSEDFTIYKHFPIIAADSLLSDVLNNVLGDCFCNTAFTNSNKIEFLVSTFRITYSFFNSVYCFSSVFLSGVL